jgi:hypothetical protein
LVFHYTASSVYDTANGLGKQAGQGYGELVTSLQRHGNVMQRTPCTNKNKYYTVSFEMSHNIFITIKANTVLENIIVCHDWEIPSDLRKEADLFIGREQVSTVIRSASYCGGFLGFNLDLDIGYRECDFSLFSSDPEDKPFSVKSGPVHYYKSSDNRKSHLRCALAYSAQ